MLLVLIPLIGTALVALAPKAQARAIAIVAALLSFVISLSTLNQGEGLLSTIYQQSSLPWLPNLGIAFHFGIDTVAAWLVILTGVLGLIAALCQTTLATEQKPVYYGAILALIGLLNGAFCALDMVLFYLFFEACLLPVYFLIGLFGGPRRQQVATKFLIYSVIGALFMLAAMLGLRAVSGTFDIAALLEKPVTGAVGVPIFLGFAIAFAIKTPMFPFHTWQSDAYRETPTPALILVAGAMAKLGTYGFYRFCIGILPEASAQLGGVMVWLAAIGIVYAAIVAAVQRDVKRVLAFSSVSHLGFIVLGLFSGTGQGVIGACFQMINHGIIVAGLLLLVVAIERRTGTTRIAWLGGLWEQTPVLARLFLIFTLASVGLPLTNGFVGEFLTLLGAFKSYPWATAVAVTGVIWSAVYMLGMYQRAFYGTTSRRTAGIGDLTDGEAILIAPLAVLVFLLGVYPTPGAHDDGGFRDDRHRPDAGYQRTRPGRTDHGPRRRGSTTMNEAIQGGVIALGTPLFLIAAAIAALLCDVAGRDSVLKKLVAPVGYIGAIGGFIIAIKHLGQLGGIGGSRLQPILDRGTLYWGGGVVVDSFGVGVNLVLCIAAFLTLLMASRYLEEKNLPGGEFRALILFATSGAMVMAQSADLVNLFVGLEVLSVALYILSGFARRERKSEESAVKYFLLGAFASGFLLYGIALIYGAVGLTSAKLNLEVGHSLTNLGAISELLGKSATTDAPLASMPIFVTGVALMLVGLGFKAALVPFHGYAPDVYEGAPSPVAAFMSSAAKLGAFAALMRLLLPITANTLSDSSIRNIVWTLAILSMIVGNILAIRQTNVKRMLAYSSIAHAGYLLVGVLASGAKGGELAADAVLFYLFAYTLMNLGAFAVTVWLGGEGREFSKISHFAGLGKRHPLAAATLTVLLLSLAGIPPTAGFVGKLYLFLGAYQAGFVGLAVAGLLASGLGLFYYLNLVVLMYFKDGESEPEPVRGDARLAAVLAAVLTLIFGLTPATLLSPKVSAPAVATVAAPADPPSH